MIGYTIIQESRVVAEWYPLPPWVGRGTIPIFHDFLEWIPSGVQILTRFEKFKVIFLNLYPRGGTIPTNFWNGPLLLWDGRRHYSRNLLEYWNGTPPTLLGSGRGTILQYRVSYFPPDFQSQ
jgi:hypothetical protein